MVTRRHKKLNEIIDERIKEWKSGETRYARKPRGTERGAPGPVVTISREAGCDGHGIAELLAENLGLALYDKEIVEMIARDKEVATHVVSTLDEKGQSELMDWIGDTLTKPGLSSPAYFRSLKRVVFTIAAHGDAVILGRGANMLVPPEKRIAIRLVAPLESRVKTVMAQMELTEKNARALVARLDEERRQFVRKYFDRDIDDPSLNDVIINTATVSPESIVDIVRDIHAERSAARSHAA